MPTEMVPREVVALLKLRFLGHQEGSSPWAALREAWGWELVCNGCSISVGEDEKLLEMVVMAA